MNVLFILNKINTLFGILCDTLLNCYNEKKFSSSLTMIENQSKNYKLSNKIRLSINQTTNNKKKFHMWFQIKYLCYLRVCLKLKTAVHVLQLHSNYLLSKYIALASLSLRTQIKKKAKTHVS